MTSKSGHRLLSIPGSLWIRKRSVMLLSRYEVLNFLAWKKKTNKKTTTTSEKKLLHGPIIDLENRFK